MKRPAEREEGVGLTEGGQKVEELGWEEKRKKEVG